MIIYVEDNEVTNCILWRDGDTTGFIKKGKVRIEYKQGKEILSSNKKPTSEFEQIPVEVDVYQELLDKEANGQIEIQWITAQDKQDKLDSDAIAESNRDVQQQIDELEKKSLRPARDLIADPSDADARVYFKEYNSQINVLRTQLIK